MGDSVSSGKGSHIAAGPSANEEKESGPSLQTQALESTFEVYCEMVEDGGTSIPWVVLVILWVYDLLHAIVAAMPPSQSMGWPASPLMQSIEQGLLTITLMPFSSGKGVAPHAEDGLWFAAFAFALMSMLFLAWMAAAFALKLAYRPFWPIKTLRILVILGQHCLLIPVIANLASPFRCAAGATWGSTTYACYGSSHLAFTAISAVTLVFLVPFLALSALLFVDTTADPSGRTNVLCAPHGRVAAAMVALRVGIALLYSLTFDSSPWAQALIDVALGLAWMGLFVWFLPFHGQWLNRLQTAFACVFTISAACSALSVGLADGTHNAAAIVWVALLPLALYLGASTAASRFRAFGAAMELSSPYLVQLRARYLLEMDGGRGRAAGGGPSTSVSVMVTGLDDNDGTLASSDATAASLPLLAHGTTRGGGGETRPLSRGGASKAGTGRGTVARGSARASARTGRGNGHTGVAAASGGSHHHGGAPVVRDYGVDRPPVPETHLAVERLFAKASLVFPASSILDIFIAQFLGKVRGNAHLTRLHIHAASIKSDPALIDVRFFVYQWNRQREKDATAVTTKMTVEKRIRFEALFRLTKEKVSDARVLVHAFWSTLNDKRPDLSRLEVQGMRITSAFSGIRQLFTDMLALAPQSAPVMREYAGFLLELGNDPRKAAELLADAEQIEDEHSRAMTALSMEQDVAFGRRVDFDMSSESLSLISISMLPDTRGLITDANAPALKLIGYNKREVIGRDVNVIIPDPIAAIHGEILEAFMDHGQETLSGASRYYFVMHRQGYIVPIRGHMASSGDVWVMIAEELQCNNSFIWFLGDESGWRVTAVCHNAQQFLGIDLVAMRAGAVTMTHFLTDIENTLDAVRQSAADGCVINLRNVAPQDGDESTVGREGGNSSVSTVIAKLQVLHIPMIDAPVYVLRYRKATALDQETAAQMRRGVAHADDDDAQSQDLGTQHAHDTLPWQSATVPVQSGKPYIDAGRVGSTVSAAERLRHADRPQAGDISGCPVFGDSSRVIKSSRSAKRSPSLEPNDREASSARHRVAFEASNTAVEEASASRPANSNAASRRIPLLDVGTPVMGRPVASLSISLPPAPPASVQNGGSVHSKGSGASGKSGGESQAATLRRSILSNGRKLEGALINLQRAIVVVFLLTALMNIAACIITEVLFSQLLTNMQLVTWNGDRGVYLVSAYTQLLELSLQSGGQANASDVGLYRDRMLDFVNKLDTTNQQLYAAVDYTQLADIVNLYTVPSIVVEDLVPESYVNRDVYNTSLRKVNLVNGIVEFVANVRRAYSLPLSDINITDPPTFWALSNAWVTLRNACNSSMLFADQLSQSQASTILTSNTAVITVSLSLFGIIAILIMVPAALRALNAQKSIFDSLLEVPIPIVTALKDRAASKIEQARKEEEAASLGMDADETADALEPGVDFEEHAAVDSPENTSGQPVDALQAAIHAAAQARARREGLALAASTSNAGVYSRCCCGRSSARNAQTKPKHASRSYRRAASNRNFVLFSMLWPVLLYCSYFVGMYFWRVQLVTFSNYAKSEVLWSKQIEFYSGQLSFNIRQAYSSCAPEFVSANLERASQASNLMVQMMDDVLYGSTSPERTVRPGLQVSPDTFNLMMVNGCVDNDNFYTSAECAKTFYHGIVSHGILGAFTEYVNIARLANRARQNQMADASSPCIAHVEVPVLEEIHNFAENFLSIGFKHASAIRFSESTSTIINFMSMDILVTAVSVITLIVYYLILYAPLIRRLDRDIKNVRMLLLLFPDEVSNVIPALTEAGRGSTGSDGRTSV